MAYEGATLEDYPDASWGEEPPFHTPDRLYVYPGRRVLVLRGIVWPHSPEDCPPEENMGTQWLFDDTVLVCRGCGLDVT